jgi:hypothetical protein
MSVPPASTPRRRWAPPRHPVALEAHVGVRLPADTIARADALADALGVTRSEIVRAGVDLALRCDLSLADEIAPAVFAWHHGRGVAS